MGKFKRILVEILAWGIFITLIFFLFKILNQ